MKKIEAKKRDLKGKKVNNLRKEGKIPGVIYGKEFDSTPILLDEISLNRVINTAEYESRLYELVIDGKSTETIIKKVKFDTYKKRVIHIDFYAIQRGQKIEVNIPIILTGEAIGISQGGLVSQYLKDLRIKCLPKEIPEHFVIDITDLNLEEYAKVKDLNIDNKFEVLNSLDETVVLIGLPAKAKAAEPTEEVEGEEGEEEGEEGEEDGTETEEGGKADKKDK